MHEISREGWQSAGEQMIKFWCDRDQYRDTGKTCLGGGMHRPIASSVVNVIIVVITINQQMTCVLAQDDLRGSLGEQSKSGDVSVQRDDGAHRLASRVERVHFAEAIFGHASSYRVAVLTERQHEAKQRALSLVANLLRQVALSFTRLSITT